MSDTSQSGPEIDARPDVAVGDLPRFDDMPIEVNTANMGHDVELHPQCQLLAPLLGVWRGEGLAQYPSLLGEFTYGQQIAFGHDGRPFLAYEARSWLLNPFGQVLRPAAREVGWWRVDEEEIIELVLAHMFGICEIYYGGVNRRTQAAPRPTTATPTDCARRARNKS